MESPMQVIVLSLLVYTTVLAASIEPSTTAASTALRQNPHPQAYQQLHSHPQHTNQPLPNYQRRHHPHQRSQRRNSHLNEQAGPQTDYQGNAGRNFNATTRLRRVGSYNRSMQRRSNAHRHNEWEYNTYNVNTNTFGAPPPAFISRSSGKGDDNTQDVEFIGSGTHTAPEWSAAPPQQPGRSYGYGPALLPNPVTTVTPTRRTPTTTSAPPPLVPARRGYTNASPTSGPVPRSNEMPTDDPFETNMISRIYPRNPKDNERRHICVQQRTITMPVKTTEVYTRPIWKHFSTPCQPQTHANQMCTRVQLIHEQAYRDVIRHKSAQQVTYDCCTGWTRETPHADGCMKPICSTRCQNGGTCSAPETCSCRAGFTGAYCEHDVNECKEDKPCDQTCINTVGSFYCRCRKGFVLQADQQSCKKIDLRDEDAFEARDLENEIDSSDDVSARLQKIERSLASERIQTNELQKSLQSVNNAIDTLKSRLSTLEKQNNDLNHLQTNMYANENRTSKLEGLISLLMKCRNGGSNCP